MFRRAALGLLAALLIVPAGPASAKVTETIEAMSLREKVGQLVMFSISGTGLTSGERDMMKRKHLGAVILFARNYSDRSQLKALTRQIRRAARAGNRHGIGALIGVDQEGGVVKRFPDMPPYRSAPEIGRTGSKSVATEAGKATGRELAESGVNVNFAPVADLDIGPNHVMRDRAFGNRRYPVAKLVNAFARGMQAKKVAAGVKHFPGLGGASANTDDRRAEVRRSRRRLREVDEIPFKRAIDGGARIVMMSHAIYTAIGDRPGSLSYSLATKRLRGALGFRGVTVSDALEPVSWWYGGDVAKACKGAMKAGVDLLLLSGGVGSAASCAAKVRKAVKSKSISEARLNRAVRRVLKLKRWVGAFDPS